MNSTLSTSPLSKNKKEKQLSSDGENSSSTKISRNNITENQSDYKNTIQDKNVVNDKKQFLSVNSYNSNVGVVNSPATSSKNLKRKQSVMKKGKKKRVTFSKNYLDVVYMESYKRYNVDVSTNGQEQNEIVRCRCSIF